eukprot:GHRQ01024016.1.p1 GENE.GHRQ01024016.1~~GHRQ01024016.1.p1  ORF type:complete len:115 (-),score=44.75 GHRQ01024016.1:163-507(-)
MFAAVGVAGLYLLQAAGGGRPAEHGRTRHHTSDQSAQQQQQQRKHPVDALPSSPAQLRPQHAPPSRIRHGSVVFFQDKRGQTAVVQPCGTGRSTWQLAVTCAASGSCSMLKGAL